MKDFQEPQQNEEDEDNRTAGEEQTSQIVETGSITGTKGKHTIHCLTIIGQIEGHYTLPAQNKTTKYEHVIPQLVAIEQDPDIEGLVIILNTVGGDVEAGLAIAELIAGMKKPTVSLVLGGGHSIGVPLACSAKYSLIAPSATMTIHPVRMSGLVLGVPQTLSYFDKMQERIVRFVTENSRIEAERFRTLMMNTGELVMDVGTVLDGEKAVAEGLINELGGLERVIAKIYELIEADKAEKERAKHETTDKAKRLTCRVRASSAQKAKPSLAAVKPTAAVCTARAQREEHPAKRLDMHIAHNGGGKRAGQAQKTGQENVVEQMDETKRAPMKQAEQESQVRPAKRSEPMNQTETGKRAGRDKGGSQGMDAEGGMQE